MSSSSFLSIQKSNPVLIKGVEQIFGKNPLAFWEDFLIFISMSKCFAVSVVDGLFSGEQAD